MCMMKRDRRFRESRLRCKRVFSSFADTSTSCSLYWSNKDVLSYLSVHESHIPSKSISSSPAEDTSTSVQRQKSASSAPLAFQGLVERSGHRIQEIKQLQTVPVIISADLSKSPPVLIVYAVNPFARKAEDAK